MAKRIEDPVFERTLYRYIGKKGRAVLDFGERKALVVDLSDLDGDSAGEPGFDLDRLFDRDPGMRDELAASLRDADEGRLIPHEEVVRRWRASRGQGYVDGAGSLAASRQG